VLGTLLSKQDLAAAMRISQAVADLDREAVIASANEAKIAIVGRSLSHD